jgi:uncharacterized repeat protein (TIGR01451 family)
MALCLTVVAAPSYALVIDDFNVNQAQITDSTVGGVVSSTQAGPTTSIIGGTRYLSVDLLAASTQEDVTAQVVGGDYSNSYDTTATGQSMIVWSGSANPSDLSLGANLCASSKFSILFKSNDHAVNYKLRVYSSAANWSQVNQLVPAGIIPPGQQFDLPFAAFAIGGGTGADFCNVGRIELVWNTDTEVPKQPALDMSIDWIEVPDEIAYQCNSKDFNGQSTLTYPETTVFPQNVTAHVYFENTGPVAIATGTMTITDTLGAGLTYIPGSTSGAPYIVGDPAGSPGPVLTWTNAVPIPANTVVSFSYGVTVEAPFNPGDPPRANQVAVEVRGLSVSSPPACSARVTVLPPNVPILGPLGLATLLLGLPGVAALMRGRRRRG